MNILLRIALCGMLCCLPGCGKSADERADRETTAVNQEFLRLKNEGLLPGLGREATGGTDSIWQVYDAGRKQAWFVPLVPYLGQCKKVYCVDVRINGRKLIYLFCFDLNPPQLLGGFEEHAGQLVPIPAPPAQKQPATNPVPGQMP